MSDLTIRRDSGFPAIQYQGVVKTEKTASSSQSGKTAGTTGLTVSETLRQLMGSQAENSSRVSRRTLQLGEAALDEVQEKLGRIAELAAKAAGGGNPDRAALQAELEQLRDEIDRILGSAAAGDTRLFLDGDSGMDEGMNALLRSLLGDTSAAEGSAQTLPDWLMQGITQDTLTAKDLLAALGLDRTASGADLLAAVTGSALENSTAASRLAALYLGAVIAGGASGSIDLSAAQEGLQQLLAKVAEGVPPDQAVALLTDGRFTSLADFQSQFTGGTAPDLQRFLVNLLLSDSGSLLTGSSLMGLLASVEGGNLELLMGLLAASSSPEANAAGTEAGTEAGTAPGDAAAPETAAAATADPAVGTGASPVSVLQLGNVQVTGQDLSGVSFNESTGQVTVSGGSDIVIRGTGQDPQAILVTGSGTVTLQDVKASALTIDTPMARIFSAGENLLNNVQLREGASLTLGGSGLLQIRALQANESNSLRLTGGAVAVQERTGGAVKALTVPIFLDGPVSLAAQTSHVSSSGGKPLEPFDIIWKALLPGWSGINALAVDGRQARLDLLNSSDSLFPARLWLEKGDSSHGYPIHTVVIEGKDETGRTRTRYAYLRWNQRRGTFEEVPMYPNPFTVSGGKQDEDWVYEEGTHTLCILSNQVSAVSGGSGVDANYEPFSGRLALADGIGTLGLTLGGVSCRVSSGRAFSLGSENDVTLLLQSGTDNIFESGVGCAGISLGDGTALCIDHTGPQDNGRSPDGTLTATGGRGGAGIGRDSGAGRDQTSRILIRGGDVTAAGTGGGAGIGAGKHGFMGSVTITGGTVAAVGGKGGGAGIGGALGAPVGDISIRGGSVSAAAIHHAAAIGAGVQGASGDIRITGRARIVKAVGGNPGADIGACLFGGCGKVIVSDGANIGRARLSTSPGISLQTGADTLTLPQFNLSSTAMHLTRLRVSTRAYARVAGIILEADRLWVKKIQASYSALYRELEQSGFEGFRREDAAGGPVRDTAAASTLLKDMRQSILQSSQTMRTHSGRGTEDVRQLLS